MPVYYPIIKKVTVIGGGGSMEGFHMVRFYNDDRTTLLYTVFVSTGASAMYVGETPVSTEDTARIHAGFEPSPVNVTEDMDCYAIYEAVTSLKETPWSVISNLSENGEAQNYFAVGDTKMIHVKGQVGTCYVDYDYGVYILGFDHNEELEGKGIHFGTFKSAVSNGVDLCLADSNYNKVSSDGTKYFNLNHWGSVNYGGWAGCDMRYDVLGSTDHAPSDYGATPASGRTGYDASATCAISPVANTLMAALPADLRAVMKPMTKYTDNTAGQNNTAAAVTATVDYLPLLSEFEIFGTRKNANQYEQDKQKQYAYFAAGNSKNKYCHSNPATAAYWWGRSANYNANAYFCFVSDKGVCTIGSAGGASGLAPIFKV